MNFLIRYIKADCKWCYHWVMMHYHGFKKRQIIKRIKKAGLAAGLPSLDSYSDDAIAEAFRQLK